MGYYDVYSVLMIIFSIYARRKLLSDKKYAINLETP